MKATLTSSTILRVRIETCTLTIGESSQYAIISTDKFYIDPKKTAGQFRIETISDDATVGVFLYVDEIEDKREGTKNASNI
jgi:hypothetical protein